jgi:hypothetical protein
MDTFHADSRSLLRSNDFASLSDLLFNQTLIESDRVHDDALFLNRCHSMRSLNDHKLLLQITDSTMKHMSASLHQSIDSGFLSHNEVSYSIDHQLGHLSQESLNRSELLINSFANQQINAKQYTFTNNSQFSSFLLPSLYFMKQNLHQLSKSFPIMNRFKQNLFFNMDTFLLMKSKKHYTNIKSREQVNKQEKQKQAKQTSIGIHPLDNTPSSSVSLIPKDPDYRALILSPSTISFVNSAISFRNYLNSLYKLAPVGQVLLRLYDVNFL